jgi:hypothetical protein
LRGYSPVTSDAEEAGSYKLLIEGKSGGPLDDHRGESIDLIMDQLHAAGWSIGDTAFVTEAGALVWLVSGRNGENVIRAEGPTQAAAWLITCDQARAGGMLAGWRCRSLGQGRGDRPWGV